MKKRARRVTNSAGASTGVLRSSLSSNPVTISKSRKTVKLRTNGKYKVDAASTISAPIGNLNRILRPQARFQWLGPQLAAITPTYIEQTMIGAMAGSYIQAWQIFDLMLKTWPELLACYNELIAGVLKKQLIFEPYREEDEKPTPSAIEKSKLVSCAIRRMEPDPAQAGDTDITGTISDILDAWFRGVSVNEVIWQNIDDPTVGTIWAPKATANVDPTNYGFNSFGTLGLRRDNGKSAGVWPYQTTSLNPQPSVIDSFPENRFLIAMHKASAGSQTGGALLRPLAWWWCAANFSSDWLLNLAQVFGLPFRWANYDTNAPPATIDAICTMLQNMGSNGWAAFPVGTTLEMIQAHATTSDHSPQGELLDRADRYARSLILGQTMTGNHGTTGKGGGQAFGQVETTVKDERIEAAGDFATSVINGQLVRSILMLNYGDAEEMPTAKFLEDEAPGLIEMQRDTGLAKGGLEIGVDYLRKKFDIPEPAEGEETIGGAPVMPPGFGADPFGNPDEAKAPDEEQNPAKAGDAPGHAFRGNQYIGLGQMVSTPSGNGTVVAQSSDHLWVSTTSGIKQFHRNQVQKITKDKSNFPSITHSAENERRKALQMRSAEVFAIKDETLFASELKELAAVAAGDKPGHAFHGNQWTSGVDKESAHPTHPLPDKHGHGQAVYQLSKQEEGDLDTHVERRPDGSYYGMADNFDFSADTAEEMRQKLKKWGARYVGWENK